MREPDPHYFELRAEWLKLRGYLFDPNSGLPALPAVVEDVRRRIEDGERIGLVYLDLRSEERLEEVYGWETYDALLRQMADALLDLRGKVLAERDSIALSGVRSDEFLLFVGTRSQEGLDRNKLARIRDQVVAQLSDRLRVQVDQEMPRGLGIHSAATMIRTEPTVRIERAIYKCVDEVKAICRREREQKQTLRLNELRRILACSDIHVRYQPIVRLEDGELLGFEALSSGPQGDIFESSEMLFSFAEQTDQLLELERLCRLQSIRGACGMAVGRKLFLNTSAKSFTEGEFFSESARTQMEEAGLTPADLVIEITERVAITAWREFRLILDSLRGDGFRIAIDDVGAGYSSLQSVAEIEPDYLKFDISLVRDIHLSRIKRNLLESLVVLAQKVDAQVIAEGVEREEEYRVLREMSVTYGQGFLFGHPDEHPIHQGLLLPGG